MKLNTFEGSLWRGNEIIRSDFAKHHRNIESGPELCSTLRAGEWTWPGCYQLAFTTSDGALLCFDCVRENLDSAIWSIRNQCNDDWRVVACNIIHGGEDETGEYCSHCDKQLAEPAE